MRRIVLAITFWLGLALSQAHAVPAAWGSIYGGCNPGVTKVVAFTSGTSAIVPIDYCSLVEVDAIGEGGTGGTPGGGGGGGGGWANLTTGTYTAGQSVPIQLGAGGSSTPTCWVSCSTLKADFGVNGATGPVGGSGGVNNVGSSTHNGGSGASVTVGGAGGAAGPNGNGSNASGQSGGSADAGSGGVGGSPGNNGGAGAEYSLTAGGTVGSGGGSGGGGAPITAGNYGGGGGGCASFCSPTLGAPGILILQYHPTF